MRKWLARKLFDLAVRLDWDEAVLGAMTVCLIDGQLKTAFDKPKRRGRPKGRKDGVGPKPEPKKRGRPLGSKNKPKVVA